MSKLIFKNEQFYFTPGIDEVAWYAKDAWEISHPGVYTTTNLKAAAEFRLYADETCERVFNRAFNKIYKAPSLPPLPFLDPHQIEGVKWILSRKRSYLAHAPGAGKTAQAVIASILSGLYGLTKIIFIVPPALTANWEREVKKFYDLYFTGQEPEDGWPLVSVVPLSNKKETMNWNADFIIVPDSMLTKKGVYERLSKFKNHFLAVDEASRFKEPTAERSRVFYGGVVKEFRHHGLYQSARHVVFLDGSPMPNRPMELWAPAYCLDPVSIDQMEQRDFGFRYCAPRLNERGNYEFTGSCREDELREKLQHRLMHVVTEEQLTHPERRRSILFMNQDVRSAEHKAWERKSLPQLLARGISETNSLGELAHWRKELGLKKIKWVADYVEERLKNKNESIIIFAWHREVCQGLAKALAKYTPGVVIGGVKASTRETIFERFNLEKSKLIIGNIGAMGRGHNLQRADRIIFAEFSWTDQLNMQCEKRASRRGRDKEKFVRCEYVAVPDSMDESILNSNFTKARRVKKVIG